MIERVWKIFRFVLVLLAVSSPIFFGWWQPLGEDFTVRLLTIFLATSAFVATLFALYSKDDRIRANSENVLICLIFFLLADLFLAISFVLSKISIMRSHPQPGNIISYIGFATYIYAFLLLLNRVFLRTYNQVYNLRTNKVWKYFGPVKSVRKVFAKDTSYEEQVEPRSRKPEKCLLPIEKYFTQEEISTILSGASILITGVPTEKATQLAIDLMSERLRVNETANYVCTDRHPLDIWMQYKQLNEGNEYDVRKNLVFIDAFTPSFGFTDDVNETNTAKLKKIGIESVSAKTLAGLHTATNAAFNIIKIREKENKSEQRRPTIMVYSHTSALCDFESKEQFRIFWRHVIPAERSYRMITLILEDELAGADILSPLRQRVDFVLAFKTDDTVVGDNRENEKAVRLKIVREK